MNLYIKFMLLFVLQYAQIDKSFSKDVLEINPRMESIIVSQVPILWPLGRKSEILEFVKKSNLKKVSLSEIKKIDQEWINGGQKELKHSIQNNPIATYFKNIVQKKKHLISEIFLCDANGPVIASYPSTSDYWQGDEDKFIESFNKGKGRVYFGPLEYDESTKTNSIQISIPVAWRNETYGVIVVGLKNIK
ncbi:MAG: hypothetical protein H6622_10290 [Halobacteriovoraceae bacterium]|nr:hypothetical protein [Halobacteriovoraceae bacterium]